MIDLDLIIEKFEEIENGCEYGSLGVFVLEDGSYWYCNRDVGDLVKDIEFRAANVSMQDALRISLLDKDELFLEQEDVAAEERRMEIYQPKQVLIETWNLDYYGTKDKYIDDFFGGAFEPKFGSDFSL